MLYLLFLAILAFEDTQPYPILAQIQSYGAMLKNTLMPAFFCHLLFIWPTIDGLDRKQQPGRTRHKAALPLSCLGLIQIRKLPLDPDAFLLTDVDQQSQDGAQQDMLQSGTEHDRFPTDPFDGQEVGGHAFIDTTLTVDQDDLVHVLWLVLFQIRAFTHPFGILHDRIRSGSVADLDLDPLLQHRTQMAEMGRQDRFFVLREHQSHCFVCVVRRTLKQYEIMTDTLASLD